MRGHRLKAGPVSCGAALFVLTVLLRPARASDVKTSEDGVAWIVNYAALHAGIMEGTVPEERRNFLVWTCRPMGTCGGLGNRIVNIVAAFALAVLTDRAFIIDYPGSSPLELERFVYSAFIDWRMPPWFEHAVMTSGSVHVGPEPNGPIGNEKIIEMRRAFNRHENWRNYEEEVLWVCSDTSDLFLTDVLRNAHLAPRVCALQWTGTYSQKPVLQNIYCIKSPLC